MNNLNSESTVTQITSRINELTPTTEATWGKMNVNQMICHVSDPIRDILGQRMTEQKIFGEDLENLKKFILNDTPFGQGFSTALPYSQDTDGEGTKPTSFENDRQTLLGLMNEYHNVKPGYAFHPHASLGILNREEAGKYLFKHLDYHLRQFGV